MNIWQTIEVDAWSRDFDHYNYLNIHEKSGNKGKVLSYDGYQTFCELMDIEYEDSFK